jgi:hypothetical protein
MRKSQKLVRYVVRKREEKRLNERERKRENAPALQKTPC